jgi:glutamine amidotransferase/cyclase
VQLAVGAEALGAGEIMLNCIDMDGQKCGYDLALINAVQQAVTIPVIASSGAGQAAHFAECFEKTAANAALAAGMFHRKEVSISDVKQSVHKAGIPIRL